MIDIQNFWSRSTATGRWSRFKQTPNTEKIFAHFSNFAHFSIQEFCSFLDLIRQYKTVDSNISTLSSSLEPLLNKLN